MSEGLTLDADLPESSLEPGEGEGVSSEGVLPEEFKPYSHIPWNEIPEESREAVLGGVKKFHGDMTRDHQELVDLRRETPLLRQKAEALEHLWNQQWFQDAYSRSQNPQANVQEQASLTSLNDHLDSDTSKAIQQGVKSAISEALGPLQSKLTGLEQQFYSQQVTSEMDQLEARAAENGWPSPKSRIDEMTALIQRGEAKTITGAYEQVVFQDIPKIAEKRALERYKSEMQKKAESTLPPDVGPSGVPGNEVFKGKDCVLRALHASKQELLSRR